MDAQHSAGNEKPPFICAACNASFVVKSHLNDHLYSHINGKFFINDICCKGFSEVFELNEYMMKNTWTCSTCKAKLFAKWDLKEHLCANKINKNNYLRCEICYEGFDNKMSLSSHYSDKHSMLFECEFCCKGHSSKEQLRAHIQRHHAPKPYRCSTCSKQFSGRTAYENHCILHTNKAFNCDKCNIQFKKISHLKVHLRTHEAEMPYHCALCDKRFRDSKSFELHLESVHNKVLIR